MAVSGEFDFVGHAWLRGSGLFLSFSSFLFAVYGKVG